MCGETIRPVIRGRYTLIDDHLAIEKIFDDISIASPDYPSAIGRPRVCVLRGDVQSRRRRLIVHLRAFPIVDERKYLSCAALAQKN